jgi:hypothetical protein
MYFDTMVPKNFRYYSVLTIIFIFIGLTSFGKAVVDYPAHPILLDSMEYSIQEGDWIGSKNGQRFFTNDSTVDTDVHITTSDCVWNNYSRYEYSHIVEYFLFTNDVEYTVLSRYNEPFITTPSFDHTPIALNSNWNLGHTTMYHIEQDVFSILDGGIAFPTLFPLTEIKESYYTKDLIFDIALDTFDGLYFPFNRIADVPDTVFNNHLYKDQFTVDVNIKSTTNVEINVSMQFSGQPFYLGHFDDWNFTIIVQREYTLNENNIFASTYEYESLYSNYSDGTVHNIISGIEQTAYTQLNYETAPSIWTETWFLVTLISISGGGVAIGFIIYQYYSTKKQCETSPMEVCKRYTRTAQFR